MTDRRLLLITKFSLKAHRGAYRRARQLRIISVGFLMLVLVSPNGTCIDSVNNDVVVLDNF